MMLLMYTVFDVKSASYGRPFFLQNDAMAIRSFSDIANDQGTMIYRHAEDFSLLCVGTFDDAVGVIKPETHRPISSAAALIKPDTSPILPGVDPTLLDRAMPELKKTLPNVKQIKV